jgi:hypothetical protein
MNPNVVKLMVTLFDEQSKLFRDHADRLRKALKDSGEEVPDAPAPSKKDGEKKTRKPRGEKKATVKRPLSAYQVFMKEHLKSYKQRHPEVQQAEVMKVIATRWSKLEAEKKAKYIEMAGTLKDEFIAGHAVEGDGEGAEEGFQVVQLTGDKTKKRKHDGKENHGDASSSNVPVILTQTQATEGGDGEGGKKKKKKKDKAQSQD